MKKRLLVDMKERFQFKHVTQHLTLEVETAILKLAPNYLTDLTHGTWKIDICYSIIFQVCRV